MTRQHQWIGISLAIAAMICLCAPATRAADSGNKSGPSDQDQNFMNKAWNINTAEIRLGKIAQDKATNADVKAFGQRMIDDHTKLNDELSSLATEVGGTLPTSLNQEHQELIDKLSKLNGSDFDKEYMNAMVKGHTKAVALFEKESKDAAQTPVDKWAGQAVSVLREHLKLAIKTGKEVGAPAAEEGSAITAGEKQQGQK